MLSSVAVRVCNHILVGRADWEFWMCIRSVDYDLHFENLWLAISSGCPWHQQVGSLLVKESYPSHWKALHQLPIFWELCWENRVASLTFIVSAFTYLSYLQQKISPSTYFGPCFIFSRKTSKSSSVLGVSQLKGLCRHGVRGLWSSHFLELLAILGF
jgi:hypothetical protein